MIQSSCVQPGALAFDHHVSNLYVTDFGGPSEGRCNTSPRTVRCIRSFSDAVVADDHGIQVVARDIRRRCLPASMSTRWRGNRGRAGLPPPPCRSVQTKSMIRASGFGERYGFHRRPGSETGASDSRNQNFCSGVFRFVEVIESTFSSAITFAIFGGDLAGRWCRQWQVETDGSG